MIERNDIEQELERISEEMRNLIGFIQNKISGYEADRKSYDELIQKQLVLGTNKSEILIKLSINKKK